MEKEYMQPQKPSDLEAYLAWLNANLAEGERIIIFNVCNNTARMMELVVEPAANSTEIGPEETFEVVILSEDRKYPRESHQIDVGVNQITLWLDHWEGGVFHNGALKVCTSPWSPPK
jgi:hypothetical protein